MTIFYLNGFYDDTNGGFVPRGAVEISDDLYRALLEGQANGQQIMTDTNGMPTLRPTQPSAAHVWNEEMLSWEISSEKQTALLQTKKAQIINRIADKLDQLQNAALVGYSQTEKDSFYRQEKEALAWQADNSADCPMLRQIAENRGVPFEILAQKVLEKSALFAQAQGALIGQKQAFEDRAERAETLEELNQIETEVGKWA